MLNDFMGCSPFARRYSGNLCWFLFLRVLRCFSSPGSLLYPMYSDIDNHPKVIGFPHSEISGSKPVCRLPEAYRRLPRPSSPLIAKASTVCAYSLDHITPNCLTTSWNICTADIFATHHDYSSDTSMTYHYRKHIMLEILTFQKIGIQIFLDKNEI